MSQGEDLGVRDKDLQIMQKLTQAEGHFEMEGHILKNTTEGFRETERKPLQQYTLHISDSHLCTSLLNAVFEHCTSPPLTLLPFSHYSDHTHYTPLVQPFSFFSIYRHVHTHACTQASFMFLIATLFLW